METPAKWKCFSGSTLKLIAIISMLIDHIAAFLTYDIPFLSTVLVTVGSKEITVYYIMRTIGRMAFPIYCFLLTEGFTHTRNRRRYALNLFIFAIVSELPWNLIHTGTLLYEKQNVFFTLLLGCLALYAIEEFKDRRLLQLFAVTALFTLSYLLKADYGYMGFALIIAMYLLREHEAARIPVGICLSSAKLRAIPAFAAIYLYNGKRGFIQGKIGKYIFYAFYPVHLLILVLIKMYIL